MYYHKRNKILAAAVIILIIGLTGYFFIDQRLKGSILQLAQSRAQLKVVEIINQAVNEKVVQETEYRDIVYVHKDDEGRIVMIQANTIVLNQIIAKTIGAVVQGLDQLDEEIIRIPLGQISGVSFLSGSGPRIGVKIVPSKQVAVAVKDRFEQAGINQTRHKIYLMINTKVKMAVPLMAKDVLVTTTIPMAETIIVGDVPETYVNFNGPLELLYPKLKKPDK